MQDDSGDPKTTISHNQTRRPLDDVGDNDFSVTLKYKPDPDKENYGPVERRGLDYEVYRPAGHVDILRREVHFEAQFHEENKDQWEEKEYDNNGGELYNRAIFDVAEFVINEEDIDPDAAGTNLKNVEHLLLKEARRKDTVDDYFEYLKEDIDKNTLPIFVNLNDEFLEDLSSAEEAIESAGLADNLSRATQRAVFAAFRNGIVVPDDAYEFYGFDEVEPPFDELVVDDSKKWAELLAWMQELVEETAGPLTFGREDSTYGMLQFLGILATSAMTGAGVRTAANMAKWDYGGDLVPYGGLIQEYINDELRLSAEEIPHDNDSEPLPSIRKQFDAVHSNSLRYADGLYFFRESQRVAEDMTHIDTMEETEYTIPGYTSDENDAEESWTFSLLSIIDNASRFTVGTRLLPEKSKYPAEVESLLSNANNHFDIQGIFTDKEMISGELINNFRARVDDDWIASAPENDKINRFISVTPSNCIGYVKSFSRNVSIDPHAVAYPHKKYLKKNKANEEDDGDEENTEGRIKATIELPEYVLEIEDLDDKDIDQRPISDYSSNASSPLEKARQWYANVEEDLDETPNVGNKSTHATYFTDRSLPERSAGGIRFGYINRWGIEETIRQLKNDFLPFTDSTRPNVRAYYMNTAVLFQNWHTLINRTPSPNLGFRLTVTSQEMLKALQHLAFKDEEDLPKRVTKPEL